MKEQDHRLMVLDKPIDIKILDTGRGINVLIAGGDSAHIGAVSVAVPGQPVSTREFPKHRDRAVSEKWASFLCDRFDTPVVVSCGIHYDRITKDQITQVLSDLDRLLESITI